MWRRNLSLLGWASFAACGGIVTGVEQSPDPVTVVDSGTNESDAALFVVDSGTNESDAALFGEDGADGPIGGDSPDSGLDAGDSGFDTGLPHPVFDAAADALAADADVPDSPAQPVTFCTQFAADEWCEDWDRATTLPSAWSPALTGGGAFAIETVKAVSPPNILSASYGAAANPGDLAFVSRSVMMGYPASETSGVELQFDIRFDAVSPTGSMAFLELDTGPGSAVSMPPGQITVSLASGHIQLSSQTDAPGVTKSAQTSGVVLQDTVYHGKLTLLLMCGGDCSDWNATLDMGQLGTLTVFSAADIGAFSSSPLTVKAGIVSATTADGTNVRIDNIVAN